MSKMDIVWAGDPTAPVPEYITKEQYTEMYNYVLTHGRRRDMYALMIHTLWYTAARISDVLSLTPSNVDVQNRTISITIHKSARNNGNGKRGKPRVLTLPLSADLTLEIMQYVGKHNIKPDERLFPMTRQNAWAEIRSVGKAIGIDVHPHMFRHGAAMQLLKSGRQLYEIQAWLAHSSPSVTFSTYARITPEMLRETARGAGLE